MLKNLLTKLKEAVVSVLPVTVIVAILMCTPVVNISTAGIVSFAISAVGLIFGIALFNLGADLAMTPMGEHVGTGLTKSKKIIILVAVCFVMGVLITVAEPDLSVLAGQVPINNIVLIATVGIGVGLFLVLGVIKIVLHKDLSFILLFFYMALFAVCAIMMDGKSGFIPLSFDSGGVTTGPITVPFIMALGVGIANTVGGRNTKENSFGLIALCSMGPMIAVMVLSLITKDDLNIPLNEAQYSVEAYLGVNFAPLVGKIVLEIVIALGLIVAFFVILQLTILKLPKKKLGQIAVGIGYTFLGLVLFMLSVTVGFMPVGFEIGRQVAAFSPVLLAVLGFVLGMVVVLAEPAVHVLNKQVEEVTGGGVKKIEMLIALSIAVGISICLSLIRMIYGFSILFYLIPGYIISLALSFFVPGLYTSIAFDSGGVASGPLTSSFILPMAIGACTMFSGDIAAHAFGVVAMVAMTPLITIQILGFKSIMSSKVRRGITMRRILSADDEQIIYFK